jgi:hypothetical protein
VITHWGLATPPSCHGFTLHWCCLGQVNGLHSRLGCLPSALWLLPLTYCLLCALQARAAVSWLRLGLGSQPAGCVALCDSRPARQLSSSRPAYPNGSLHGRGAQHMLWPSSVGLSAPAARDRSMAAQRSSARLLCGVNIYMRHFVLGRRQRQRRRRPASIALGALGTGA